MISGDVQNKVRERESVGHLTPHTLVSEESAAVATLSGKTQMMCHPVPVPVLWDFQRSAQGEPKKGSKVESSTVHLIFL